MIDIRRTIFAFMMMLELISIRNNRDHSTAFLTSKSKDWMHHFHQSSLEQIWRLSSRLVVGASQTPKIYQTDCPIKLFSRDTADNQEEAAPGSDSLSGAAAGENTGAKQLDNRRRRRRRSVRLHQLLSDNQPSGSAQPNYISEIGTSRSTGAN
jgi:hypothetical protein